MILAVAQMKKEELESFIKEKKKIASSHESTRKYKELKTKITTSYSPITWMVLSTQIDTFRAVLKVRSSIFSENT